MKQTAQQLRREIEQVRHSISAYETDFARTGFDSSREEIKRLEAKQAELKKQLRTL